MVSVLRKILPKPIYRILRNFFNPPKPIDRSLNYFDLIIILDVRRSKNVQTDHLDALEWLKQANRSFHDTSPQILRCEMHSYTYSKMGVKVHINIRFDSQHSYEKFTYQGVALDKWMLDMEGTADWWTIELYQRRPNFLAGFDRGGPGRNLMVPADDAKVKPIVRTNSSAIRRESSKRKERAEASSSAGPSKSFTGPSKSIAGPSKSSAGPSKVKKAIVGSGSVPLRRKSKPRLDPIVEEGEEIEMVELSAVQKGKRREL